MAYYAIVVVVDAPDAKAAHDAGEQASTQRDGVVVAPVFVGDPWEVRPTVEGGRDYDMDGIQIEVEPEFDTLDCFDQRPC